MEFEASMRHILLQSVECMKQISDTCLTPSCIQGIHEIYDL